MAAPDFGSYSLAEKTELLAAAKAELLRRHGMGSVQSGSSTGEQYVMDKVPYADLCATIDALSADLGYPQPNVRIQPNFAGRAVSWPET